MRRGASTHHQQHFCVVLKFLERCKVAAPVELRQAPEKEELHDSGRHMMQAQIRKQQNKKDHHTLAWRHTRFLKLNEPPAIMVG